MKRVIAVILVLCMALSLCACSSSGSGSASGEKVIKIGVFEPSSGDSASGGKKEILGMQYANSQEPTVTLGGETYKVELVYGDNGSSTDKAPSAASSLVSAGVSVVLGSYGSGVSMAGGPKFEEAGIPAIGITCTNPNVTAGNSYYFRICFLDNFQADVLANFAVSKFSAKTAYCLGESGNEYDQGLIAFFTKVFEAAGGKVITDSFPTGNSDFGSYLNKAKSEGADVIFTPVSIAYAVQIITQAASLGIEAPFLGSDTLDDNMVLEAIKGTDLQLYVSTFYQEGGAPEFDTGVKEYINASSEALAANGGNDCMIIAACATLICLTIPKQMFSLFSNVPEVIDLGEVFLRIMIVHFFCSAFVGAFQSMITGCGFVEMGFAIGILDGVVCKIGFSLLFLNVFGIGETSFWWGTAVSRLLPGCLCLWYFLSGKWRTRKMLSD